VNDTWGPPELIALDIDGTIMNFGQPISERVLVAIRKAVASGAHVVLATGRSVISARPVVAELGLTGHVVCSDGAIRIDAVSGEVISVHKFDAAALVGRLRVLLPEAVFAAEQHPGEETLVTGEFPGFGTHPERVVDHDTLVSTPVSRLTVYWGGYTADELSAKIATVGIPGVRYLVAVSSPWLVAVREGISKASALEELRVELDVPPEATLAVGDGDNDLEMLRWAARGVAMGQAPDIVKAAADEVTAPVNDDGLALVLERWF
jgi:hydroxymethylpyrimidine pyrophosphatase-like HAD family hydrolase